MKIKREEREWAERLEAGAEDDELLQLAARLRQVGQETPPTPSLAFQQQLRRDLLNQYTATPRRGASVWQWAGSLAAVGLLVVIVGLMWLSISSSGRPSFGGPPPSVYRLTGHMVSTLTQPDGAQAEVSQPVLPGTTLLVGTHWNLPSESADLTAFVQLLGKDGQVVAQGDSLLQPANDASTEGQFVAFTPLSLPVELAAAAYELVSGLVDPATGTRLPLSSEDGAVTALTLAQVQVGPTVASGEPSAASGHEGLHAALAEAREDTLLIHEVTPAAGTVMTGSAPLEFVVNIDYALVSLPDAVLEVRVVERSGEDGRGVGLTTTELAAGVGTTTVVVTVNPSELTGPADLGLWLQLKANASSRPVLIAMPEDVSWPYEP